VARRKSDENDYAIPPPATTLEGREDQLIAAAVNLIEKRIYEETASAQEVLWFAKQGSVRAREELAELKSKNQVLLARVVEMENRASSEELMERALKAFKGYRGDEEVDVEGEGFYDQEPY